MVLIFDLDDTLYSELSFVHSGFRAVAALGEERFDWPAADSARRLSDILAAQGRGRIFDNWLGQRLPRVPRTLVQECVKCYRHHFPDIALPEEHRRLLENLAAKQRIYLVTDGHKIAQANKIAALRIAPYFEHCYITHRYGLAAAKPSMRCFDLIRRRENCSWQSLVYIGDNPAKDFVGLNRAGGVSVRVLTGQHADAEARPGYEAGSRLESLCDLPELLRRMAA
jgi:putative hydrolase of the HAD superfamily